MAVNNREGFWYSKYEPYLPKPVENEKPWKGQKAFTAALIKKQSKAGVKRYRGWSTCRLCGEHNGSTEYVASGWVWPVGFKHYVEKHNVRPSLAFQEFILGHEVGEKS